MKLFSVMKSAWHSKGFIPNFNFTDSDSFNIDSWFCIPVPISPGRLDECTKSETGKRKYNIFNSFVYVFKAVKNMAE